MENYNLNYEYRREVDSESSSEDSSEENYHLKEQSQGVHNNRERDMVNVQDIKYQTTEYNIVIDSNDRDWSGLHKNTFLFDVKFNTSGTSKEEVDEFKDPNTNQIDLINKTIGKFHLRHLKDQKHYQFHTISRMLNR